MARFNYELTIDKIEKFKAEGRGLGEYEDYKSWLSLTIEIVEEAKPGKYPLPAVVNILDYKFR